MTLDEAKALLKYVASVDGRNMTNLSPGAWADLLRDVPAPDAWEAARAHFLDSREWLQPAHIVAFVRERRRQQRLAPPVEEVLGREGAEERGDPAMIEFYKNEGRRVIAEAQERCAKGRPTGKRAPGLLADSLADALPTTVDSRP